MEYAIATIAKRTAQGQPVLPKYPKSGKNAGQRSSRPPSPLLERPSKGDNDQSSARFLEYDIGTRLLPSESSNEQVQMASRRDKLEKILIRGVALTNKSTANLVSI